MVSSMAGGPVHHQQIIIDLTKDEDDMELDEDDEEDDVGQAHALMAAFGGHKSLKRKSSSDGTEGRERPGSIHQVVVPAPPPANAINHGVTTKIQQQQQQQHVKQQTTPKDEIKREPQIWISRNKLFPGLRHPNSPPPSRVKMISSRSSSASASFSSSEPTLKPSHLHKLSNTSADSNSNSNSSKQGDRAQSTAPMKSTSTKQKFQIAVEVPPPPVKKKINRRPSISSDGASESDTIDNKGIKTKYYPLDTYKIQADKGRYPKARHTNQNQIDLPLRLSPAQNNRPKSTHGKTLLIREMLERKLRAIQGPPVTMARDWDGRGSFASNFEFTNTYKLQKGVKRADQEFNYGCECGVHCDPQKCSCLSKEEDSEELMAVYEHRNGKLLLKESFLNRKTMIYECSSLCLCPPSCWNRLVQHGRKIRLEIFHTGNRGFGLRSPEFIHRGQFIDTYLGEVITSAEADARESANNNGSIQSHSYLFSLDWFADAGDQDEEDDDDDDDDDDDKYRDKKHGNTSTIDSNKPFVVDGQRFGGVTRFMNHSCNPNCKLFAVSTHQGDRKIYDLAFFARRDIPPGIELTFDYNPNSGLEPKTIDPNAVKCLCGEARCRGQLWPTQTKSTSA